MNSGSKIVFLMVAFLVMVGFWCLHKWIVLGQNPFDVDE